MVFDIIIFKEEIVGMKNLFTIGSLIMIFGSSMLLFTTLLFTYIDNRHIPLSPLFIVPTLITIIGIIIMYMSGKYYD